MQVLRYIHKFVIMQLFRHIQQLVIMQVFRHIASIQKCCTISFTCSSSCDELNVADAPAQICYVTLAMA